MKRSTLLNMLIATTAFAFYSTTTLFNSADAAEKCASVLNDASNAASTVSSEQKANLEQVITQVNSFTTKLKIPTQPAFVWSDLELNPRADSQNGLIYIGVRYGYDLPGVEKHFYVPTEYTKAVLAHEYGHIIFSANFSKAEPLWAEYQKLSIEIEKQIEPLQKRFSELGTEFINILGELNTEKDPNAVKELKIKYDIVLQEYEGVAKEIADKKQALAPYIEIFTPVSPYNEFFADVVAVLYAERSDAISRALQMTRADQKKEYRAQAKTGFQNRDFSGHIRRNLPTVAEQETAVEAHNYLGAVRKQLWDSYLASPTYLKTKKGEIMAAVFKAVASEIEFCMNHSELKLEENQQLMNKRLNEAIAKELALVGIEPLK